MTPDMIGGKPTLTVDQSLTLLWGLVNNWYGTLNRQHNESTHQEILNSLKDESFKDYVCLAALNIVDSKIDFDVFAEGIRYQARHARAAGLVLPDGKKRKRQTDPFSGDLFGGGSI